MNSIAQDLRYSARMLARRPGFAAGILITLALTIGANSAIFSVINGVLLEPLHFKNPERLVVVGGVNRAEGAGGQLLAAAPDFIDWKKHIRAFDSVAATYYRKDNLTGDADPEVVKTATVSATFFPLLDVAPYRGRLFFPEEDRPESDLQLAVLSYGFWQRHFGGDPAIVGKGLRLSDRPHTVIGILPPDFDYPLIEADVWVPMAVSEDEFRWQQYLTVIARLKPGVKLEEAQTEATTLGRILEQQYPSTNTNRGILLIPLQQYVVRDIKRALLVLFGAAGLVLAIACVNLSNLLLAYSSERERDMAIRMTLGASRGRIVRQVITEGTLISCVGGGLGLLIALWSQPIVARLGPVRVPIQATQQMNIKVAFFTLVVSVVVGILFSLAPALQLTKGELSQSLKEGVREAQSGFVRHRLRSLLVISELALALMLLIGGALMIKSLYRLLKVDPGFDAENLLTMRITASSLDNRLPESRARLFEHAVAELKSLPGVVSAGATSALPLSGDNNDIHFTVEGRPLASSQEKYAADYRAVSPEYFATMGIKVLRGRAFSAQDAKTDSAPHVAIINETLAKRFWPGEDPIGKRIKTSYDIVPEEVVGIVQDVRHSALGVKGKPELYVPIEQSPPVSVSFVIRTSGDPNGIAASVRARLLSASRGLPVEAVATMEQLIYRSTSEPRLQTFLLGCFAALSLMLAAVGVYGVMSNMVRQRTHEIGVRMALGAEGGDIIRLILTQSGALILIGSVIGLAGGIAFSRLIDSLLYGVKSTDPGIYATMVALLAAVALTASYIPARRATRVSPLEALRYE
jgi:putative ABC transport system permease protein